MYLLIGSNGYLYNQIVNGTEAQAREQAIEIMQNPERFPVAQPDFISIYEATPIDQTKKNHAIDGWMPISTAPKDGTFILVSDHKGETHKAAWMEDKQVGRKGPHDWCIADTYQDEQGGYYTVEFPAHWKPLPLKPPA